MSKYRTWREYLINRLASQPERAGGYLQAAFEEYQIHRDPAVFLLALHTVVESQGGITELSKKIEMSQQSISEILNSKELPRIEILTAILNALGCHIMIQPIAPCEHMYENITIDSVNSNIEFAAKN
ncbi:helix-turn-helix domain-containing protein [Candidatus Poribacteria bacterium]|nr:helix-turn-helix domain-containing protein [Candidatus Poribacteria bacterium]